MPIYVLSMAALALRWLGWGVFLETAAHKLEHFICGHPQKKFADPQPTQVTNSRYGTERLTEGT